MRKPLVAVFCGIDVHYSHRKRQTNAFSNRILSIVALKRREITLRPQLPRN